MKIEQLETERPAAAPTAPALTVAVCVGTYNQGPYLRECIESIFAQSYPVHEVWVSDDASTDNTPEVMAELCKLYPTVSYYRQPRNLGIAGNLSWVLAQPTTDLIGRIDSDDRYEPDYIATLAELLRLHPEAGYAHCDIHEIDSSGKPLRVRRLSRTAEYESPDESLRRSASGYRVAANCILYRSAALRQADYYHPNEGWKSAEDWDLCLRLAIHDWGNVYAPAALASYRVWDDELQSRFRRSAGELESMIKIYSETLEPEYLRRGWKTNLLKKYRRSRAISFVCVLDSPLLSQTEKSHLKTRMHILGDCPALDFSLFLSRLRLGFLLTFSYTVRFKALDLVKFCLRKLRSKATNREAEKTASL
ncbi:glycosyltransferase [Telmatobacter bradus]|uniref:glycosyltransferase n=1 Tax=Telmatobacter bradus TaxID=474953 RepID=UPI003B4387E9